MMMPLPLDTAIHGDCIGVSREFTGRGGRAARSARALRGNGLGRPLESLRHYPFRYSKSVR
jgi:hypothetical protein